jgi:hypothetical protein
LLNHLVVRWQVTQGGVVKYQIWHDNDFDVAQWFYKNLKFGVNDVVEIRQIPKTNSKSDLASHLKSDFDLNVLPAIRLETPDLILIRQNPENQTAETLLVVELMTHTPQHDHPLQRFSRLYNAALIGVPSFLVLPTEKEKLEKGKKGFYKPTLYKANPLAFHLFIETTTKLKTDTLLLRWPTSFGYLKYDKKHPTAPRVEGEIWDLFTYAQALLDGDSISIVSNKILTRLKSESGYTVGQKVDDYALSTVFPGLTSTILSSYSSQAIPHLSSLLSRKESIVYSPQGLKSGSNDFRTDPYGGKVCAFDILFCRDQSGLRISNLILRANKVEGSRNGKATLVKHSHLRMNCPFISPTNWENANNHFLDYCPYIDRKQQRIFGEVPDLVIYDGGEVFESTNY